MTLTDITPNLIVADIARSTAFYRDVLGFSAVTSVPDQPPFAFVWMQRGGVNVFLNALTGVTDDLPAWGSRPIGGTNAMYVTVEAETAEHGVDALFRACQGLASIVMAPKNQFYGMREFGIEDPDGYVMFFAQRVG
jgi:uncharacterized glyoxalase superfamily protein PhnB